MSPRPDPHQVAAQLEKKITGGKVPVLCCFERVGSGQWCHRSLAAERLAGARPAGASVRLFKDLAQDPPSAQAAGEVDLMRPLRPIVRPAEADR